MLAEGAVEEGSWGFLALGLQGSEEVFHLPGKIIRATLAPGRQRESLPDDRGPDKDVQHKGMKAMKGVGKGKGEKRLGKGQKAPFEYRTLSFMTTLPNWIHLRSMWKVTRFLQTLRPPLWLGILEHAVFLPKKDGKDPWFKEWEQMIPTRSGLTQLLMGIDVTGEIAKTTITAENLGPPLELSEHLKMNIATTKANLTRESTSDEVDMYKDEKLDLTERMNELTERNGLPAIPEADLKEDGRIGKRKTMWGEDNHLKKLKLSHKWKSLDGEEFTPPRRNEVKIELLKNINGWASGLLGFAIKGINGVAWFWHGRSWKEHGSGMSRTTYWIIDGLLPTLHCTI